MTEELLGVLQGLCIRDNKQAQSDGSLVDPILYECRPRKRTRTSKDNLRKELEHDFLTPSTAFGPDWLNVLQQYVYLAYERAIADETAS